MRLKGPAASIAASGKLGGALIFTEKKTGSFAKVFATPAQPRTQPQLAIRALAKFLGPIWKTLSSAEQLTWELIAARRDLYPYHAFVQTNQLRWNNRKPPSAVNPPTESNPLGNNLGWTAWGQVRMTQHVINYTWSDDPWGAILFRQQTTPVAKTRTTAVAFLEIPIGTTITWRDTPLDPGTYYYRYSVFSRDGRIRGLPTEKTCVVS